jgi:hypothetical protein
MIPVQVYNANRSLNIGGPITDYVTPQVTIQDHVKQLEFTMSDLGNQDMFIGHEWLTLHNPSINWRRAEVCFDQCPPECGCITSICKLEADINNLEDHVEPLMEGN